MRFERPPVNRRAARVNHAMERVADRVARAHDRVRAGLRLGGRRAAYDDERYEFLGGAGDVLRRKHYDKSLRLLWKAEEHAPWSSFHDLSGAERAISRMATETMTGEEQAARARLTTPEFRALLDREYTRRQKEALVAVLAAIGHGEAYAWLVSAELLGQVRSTGGKAAFTMQVLEEAKHFVVMRELVQAFGVPVPRQSGWEYVLLERILKAKGLEKLFGMNVLVESIALGIFGLLADLPGLEILRLFHLDESRHTALPENYLKEFPLSRWGRRSPVRRFQRTVLSMPALPLILYLEEDLAELGVDVFDFAGSVMRKIVLLSERNGFDLLLPGGVILASLNRQFNAYCRLTRQGHRWRDFAAADTTRGRAAEVERGLFAG